MFLVSLLQAADLPSEIPKFALQVLFNDSRSSLKDIPSEFIPRLVEAIAVSYACCLRGMLSNISSSHLGHLQFVISCNIRFLC